MREQVYAECWRGFCNLKTRARVFIYRPPEIVGGQEQVKAMIGNKKSRKSDKQLDRLGRELVRASTSDEVEVEAAASSPFLYTRIRARINAELERRVERESWLAVLGIVWRVVPAMALVAVFALIMFVSARLNRQPSVASNDYTLLSTSSTEVENVVFADTRNMSSDDVLATIVSEDEQEASR